MTAIPGPRRFAPSGAFRCNTARPCRTERHDQTQCYCGKASVLIPHPAAHHGRWDQRCDDQKLSPPVGHSLLSNKQACGGASSARPEQSTPTGTAPSARRSFARGRVVDPVSTQDSYIQSAPSAQRLTVPARKPRTAKPGPARSAKTTPTIKPNPTRQDRASGRNVPGRQDDSFGQHATTSRWTN